MGVAGATLNDSAHPATEGLGRLNTRADASIGLWIHDTLALTPEGVPLGLLDVQLWAVWTREVDPPAGV